METVYIQCCNKIYSIEKETPIHHETVKQNISTLIRPLPQIPNYEPQFIDPHYEQYTYCFDDLYDQDKLQYKHNFNKPPEEVEDDDINPDSHVSNKLRSALTDLWTFSPQLPITSPLPNFGPPHNLEKYQKPVINTEIIRQLRSIPGKNSKIQPASTNLQLKNKKIKLYFPMDSGKLTHDGFIDTSALTNAISERTYEKFYC